LFDFYLSGILYHEMGMGELDRQITEFFYRGSSSHQAIYAWIAQLTIYLVPVILLVMLIFPRTRLASLKIGGAALIAWLIFSQLIGYVCFHYWGFRLRPFAGQGLSELFFERPDKAFPSDHAAVLAALTAGLFIYRQKKLGWLMLVVALVGSLTRVMIGFHWAGDIVTGWLIGLLAIGLVWSLDDLANKIGNFLLKIIGLGKKTSDDPSPEAS